MSVCVLMRLMSLISLSQSADIDSDRHASSQRYRQRDKRTRIDHYKQGRQGTDVDGATKSGPSSATTSGGREPCRVRCL